MQVQCRNAKIPWYIKSIEEKKESNVGAYTDWCEIAIRRETYVVQYSG